MSPRFLLTLLCTATFVSAAQPPAGSALVDARRGFQTKLLRQQAIGVPAEPPPAGVFDLVSYPAPLGRNAAYVSPRPAGSGKHPAVIWLVGGFSNSIGDFLWIPAERANDQSASGFRAAGVVTMFPSLRGGNENPGHLETFFGEVDDVLAAAKFLASLDYVDPSRIYLGGHSTGGTLALLVAAAAGDRFRAVFSLGPVEDVTGYGDEVLPFDLKNPKEGQLREPQRWLADIRCPTFVFEGTKAPANVASLRALQRRSRNPLMHFTALPGETHFTLIAPLVERFARSIKADATSGSAFTLVE